MKAYMLPGGGAGAGAAQLEKCPPPAPRVMDDRKLAHTSGHENFKNETHRNMQEISVK